MISLRLALDRRSYFPYDRVRGRLRVITKAPCVLDVLSLTVTRMLRLEIHKGNEPRPIVAGKGGRDPQCRHRFPVLANRELCAGEHVFPFSFALRGSESASARLNERFNDLRCIFENIYQIEAVGEADGKSETARVEVPIYNRLDSVPYVDIKFKVDTLLCLRRSVYLYRIVTDKAFYNTGDTVGVSCFPTSICPRSLIRGIDVGLYEMFSYKDGRTAADGDRLLAMGRSTRLDRNEFRIEIDLPFNLCGTVSNDSFTAKTALFFTIHFHHGRPLKVRKYIDVGRSVLTIPEIEEASLLSGIQYNEALLEF